MEKFRYRMKNILITGAAGFIGSALVRRLFLQTNEPQTIVGLDNLNDYYDVSLKEWRQKEIEREADKYPNINYIFVIIALIELSSKLFII